MTEPTTRSEYIAGLRALADLLEAHDDVILPYGAGADDWAKSVKMTFYCGDKAEFIAFTKAFPGKLDKQVDEGSPGYGFELHGRLHGLHLYAAVKRSQVCTRVVTGTREVTTKVPAPGAPVVPMVEITQTVEDVEWICEPLLAEAVSE